MLLMEYYNRMKTIIDTISLLQRNERLIFSNLISNTIIYKRYQYFSYTDMRKPEVRDQHNRQSDHNLLM